MWAGSAGVPVQREASNIVPNRRPAAATRRQAAGTGRAETRGAGMGGGKRRGREAVEALHRPRLCTAIIRPAGELKMGRQAGKQPFTTRNYEGLTRRHVLHPHDVRLSGTPTAKSSLEEKCPGRFSFVIDYPPILLPPPQLRFANTDLRPVSALPVASPVQPSLVRGWRRRLPARPLRHPSPPIPLRPPRRNPLPPGRSRTASAPQQHQPHRAALPR